MTIDDSTGSPAKSRLFRPRWCPNLYSSTHPDRFPITATWDVPKMPS
jgi:hypothetical protein